MNIQKANLLLWITLLWGGMEVFSQQSAVYRDPDADLKEGIELFHKSQYGAAQVRLTEYLRRTEGQEATSRSDAAFYQAMCAIRLDQNNGEALVTNFLKDYPESSKTSLACFEMGKLLFQEKKVKRSQRWLLQVVPAKLNRDLVDEYKFYLGYSYFDEKDYKRAQPLFEQILNTKGNFAEAAGYYYYYTLYQAGNYDKALKGFLGLQNSKEFGPSVNFCIAQIYYYQGKFEEVINLAGQLIKNAKPDQQTEMARIIGDSYFRLNKFSEAIPYLEQYRKGTKTMSREEHYSLGFAYYKNKQLSEAVKELEQVSDANDQLTQNSSHLLGGILVDLNDKLKARSAFRKAASLKFDRNIQEESLLNYAKLNFDLSISGETLRAFEEFLNTFPDSKYQDEVYDYLVKVFMNTRNYQEALVTLDKIKSKSPEVSQAYQRIAYYRGLELFNNLKYREAIEMLDKSLEYGQYDDHMRALCYYWQAEAWYNMKGYQRAMETYDRFMSDPAAAKMPEYALAQYGTGYCYFNLEKYDQAVNWFRKYISVSKKQDKLLADAYNRAGDCLFMNRLYWQAIESYDKAMALKTDDTGYAMFQKGFSYGLVQRPSQKIDLLNRLMKEYPRSQYLDDAMFEIGRSYIDLNQPLDAIQAFKDLIQKFPNSSYVRKAYIQLGLIYYNSDQNVDALAMYKKVVAGWPDTQEAVDALAGIKNIYIEKNQVDEYLSYVEGTGRSGNVTVSEQDSLIYMAAENVYMQGDYERSKENFAQYITRFPQGHFILSAYYYKGDCHYRSNQLDEALSAYSFILARGKNQYSETALARSAEICYQQANFSRALVLYRQLEQQAENSSNILDAKIGIMRCAYRQKDYDTVIQSAKGVLGSEKVPEEIIREASYILGKALLDKGDSDEALSVFRTVARDVKNKEGAESKYMVAEILFRQGNADQAEKEILDFLDQNTTHQYWLAKAYILWSDIYLKRQDLFQAKATLQILKENYARQDDGILTALEEKLKWIDSQNKEK